MRRSVWGLLLIVAVTLIGVPGVARAEVLDPAYGRHGIASGELADGRPSIYAERALGDGSGRMLVLDGEGLMQQTSRAWRITRFRADGASDRTFGTTGELHLPWGLWPRDVSAVAGHGIVVRGIIGWRAGETPVDVVLRYTDAGLRDTRFGDGGRYDAPAGTSVSQAFLGEDGRLVMLRTDAATEEVAVYAESGSLDPGFGGDGAIEAPGWPIAMDIGGRLLHAACSDGIACTGIGRLATDGSPDSTFADGSIVPVSFRAATERPAAALAEDRIYVATAGPRPDTTSVWRFSDTGALDTAFGTDGRVELDIEQSTTVHDTALLAPLTGGELAVGSLVAREPLVVVDEHGVPDPRFGVDGSSGHPELFTVGVSADESGDVLIARRVLHGGYTYVGRYSLVSTPPGVRVVSARPFDRALRVTFELLPESSGALGYLVMAKRGTTVAAHHVVGPDEPWVTLEGLRNGTTYDVQVLPILLDGLGRSAGTVPGTPTAVSPGRAVPAFVSKLTLQPGDGKLRATWSPPTIDGGSPIVAYSVVVSATGSRAPVAWRNVGPDVRTAVVDGLTNGVTYEVNVLAWNSQGLGLWQPATGTPRATAHLGGAPEVPWVVAGRAAGATHVVWGAPIERGEPNLGFDVVVVEAGRLTHWVRTGPDVRRAQLPAMTPGSTATVYVVARSATGWGPLGPPATV